MHKLNKHILLRMIDEFFMDNLWGVFVSYLKDCPEKYLKQKMLLIKINNFFFFNFPTKLFKYQELPK